MKLLMEFGPLLGFFIAYKFLGLIPATGVLVGLTLITVVITYFQQGKVPLMPLLSAVILTIFGGLTLLSDNEWFIKVKPTIINSLFAAILLGGVWIKKQGLLKYLFNNAITMDEKAWQVFSLRWGMFFIGLAILNEVIWRNFSTDFWVQFKVFGMLPITVLFMLTQLPFLKKQMESQEGEKA